MSKQAGKIVLGYSDESLEWPEAVKTAFVNFVESGYGHNFRVICAIGFDYEQHELTIRFAPEVCPNEHRVEMCEDLAEMFHALGRRFQQ